MATSTERHRAWRERNPGDYTAQQRARERIRRWVSDTKASTGCRDCDECDPAKLHFHHLDPTTKLFNIGHGRSRKGQAAIASEIEKCVVLCHPCHVLEHKAASA